MVQRTLGLESEYLGSSLILPVGGLVTLTELCKL